MAHKMGAGSTRNTRESESKRLGLKCSENTCVKSGSILVRQRGMSYIPGNNVKMGKDFTLYAHTCGVAYFSKRVVTVVKI